MTGYSPEQLNSGELRWDTLTPPEWIPVTLRSVEELRSTGSSSPFEKEYVRPDGSRWWRLFAGKMLDSSSGIEFVIDITERKRAEAALRESEEKYRTLVENVGDHAIYMLDPEGFVTEWTRSAEQVKGYAPEEVLGRHFSMFSTPQDVAAGVPERELAEAAREGRAEREGLRVSKAGERIWVNEIATAVRDDEGRLIGFTKISRDLTERRRTEVALRESEERYRLAADAAGLGRWEFIIETAELRADAVFNEHHGAPPD